MSIDTIKLAQQHVHRYMWIACDTSAVVPCCIVCNAICVNNCSQVAPQSLNAQGAADALDLRTMRLTLSYGPSMLALVAINHLRPSPVTSTSEVLSLASKCTVIRTSHEQKLARRVDRACIHHAECRIAGGDAVYAVGLSST